MKISFIAATYNRPEHLRVLLNSLIVQEENNWECLIMDEADNKHVIPNDSRFIYHKVERVCPFPDGPYFDTAFEKASGCRGSYGLLPKQAGIPLANNEWLAFPNEDSYYVPQFTKIMKQAHEQNPNIDIIASDFLFDRIGHKVVETRPIMGFVDVSNYVVRKSKIGNNKFSDFFQDTVSMGRADGFFVEKLVKDGAVFGRVPKVLVVHN